jgi:hypothetical protein
VAAVSEQAANILDYLKNKLAPVNPWQLMMFRDSCVTVKCVRHSPDWIAAARKNAAVDAQWKASGAGERFTKGARSVF